MNCAVAAATAGPRSRMLAPLAMTTPMPMAGLFFCRTSQLGGSTYPCVTVAMSPERKPPPVAFAGGAGDRRDPVERAGPPQRHALRRRLHRAGRHDGILPRQRAEDLVAGDAEAGELGIGELDEDLLVLRAVQVDLGDVLHLEQP